MTDLPLLPTLRRASARWKEAHSGRRAFGLSGFAASGPCGCCGTPVDAYCCVCFNDGSFVTPYGVAPVGLAGSDITVTLDAAWDGRTTFTLTRDGGLCQWSSSCFQVTTGTTGYYKWQLVEFGVGNPGKVLRLQRWAVSATCTGPISNLYDYAASSAPTANPFSFTAVVGGATPPGAAGATSVTATQADNDVHCYWTPFIQGCFGTPISGAFVELIYSGSTFASGTTDGTGYTPPIDYTDHEGDSGVTYKVTATGYDVATGDFKCSGSGLVSTVFLTTASGYCCQRFRVLGCLSAAVEDAVVTVYNTMGGTQLAQGTTNADGEVALSWHASCSVYVTVTHPSGRFADYGNSFSLTTEQTTEITLSAATGYQCSDFCNEPLSETLFATDPNGTWTLTYNAANANGAGWYGCATKTGMTSVVTALAGATCFRTTGTADTKYTIKVPKTGTTLANYWGYLDQAPRATMSTPTCAAGVLTVTAGIPAGCVGIVKQGTGTATGNPDSCPESLSITATMPSTGTSSTANPGAGDIEVTE